MRRIPIALLALLLTAMAAIAGATASERLPGDWEAMVKGEGAVFPIDFHFAVKGDALSGTVELPSVGNSTPISKGKINGNAVTFRGLGNWSGVLEGDDLKLTRVLDGGKKQSMTAHRMTGQ